MEEANRCGSDVAKLKDILSSILLICKVFYSLNFQVSKLNITYFRDTSKT